ncbi:MAG: hypothetical protein JSU65_08945 [Candidatus Zixiibacteriota bacterium]|nr:MAG: hypothetical protein JSU65_08945 [candidate division Zixibacteria bacterium]
MKKTFMVMFLLAALPATSVLADGAWGSSFGTLWTARSLGQGGGDMGVGLGLGDNSTSFTGSFAYGLTQFTDVRFKLGLVDPDGGDTEFSLGADFKWQFWNFGPTTTNPFDFAVGGTFEFVDYDWLSVLQLGGFLVGSYPAALSNNTTLSPYGRFGVRLESVSNGGSDSDLELGLSGGVEWQVTPTVALFGEFQLDGNDGLFFGIDFEVM